MALCDSGQATMSAFYFWIFLRLFLVVDVDGSFPKSRYII